MDEGGNQADDREIEEWPVHLPDGTVIDEDYVERAVRRTRRASARATGRPSIDPGTGFLGGPAPVLQVRVPKTMLAEIDKAARNTGMSRSEWVRQVLDNAANSWPASAEDAFGPPVEEQSERTVYVAFPDDSAPEKGAPVSVIDLLGALGALVEKAQEARLREDRQELRASLRAAYQDVRDAIEELTPAG